MGSSGTEATEEEAGTTLGVSPAKVPGSTSHFSTSDPISSHLSERFPQSYAFSLSRELGE